MEISKIVELLNGQLVVHGSNKAVEIETVCSTDLMSDVLRFATKGTLLVTALNQAQVIRTAEIADIPAVIMVMGKAIEKELTELAEKKDITLISTNLPTFTTCGILYAEGLIGCLEGQ